MGFQRAQCINAALTRRSARLVWWSITARSQTWWGRPCTHSRHWENLIFCCSDECIDCVSLFCPLCGFSGISVTYLLAWIISHQFHSSHAPHTVVDHVYFFKLASNFCLVQIIPSFNRLTNQNLCNATKLITLIYTVADQCVLLSWSGKISLSPR